MMRLLGVEIRRDLSRRLVWVLVGLALLAIAIMGVAVFLSTERPTATTQARVEARHEQYILVCTRQGMQLEELSESEAERGCRAQYFEGDTLFRLTELFPKDGNDPMLGLPFTLLLFGGLLGGASMIGAEWRAGTVATWLTWEPRRVRLFLAKVVAAVLLAAIIAIILDAIFSLAIYPTAHFRGSTDGADGEWFRGVVEAVLRSGALTGIAAAIGIGIAMIGRNTAAALGLVVGYVAIVESLVRAIWPDYQGWLLGSNIAVFISGATIEDPGFDRSVAAAGLTLAGYAIFAVALAAVLFKRRDIASV